MQKVCCSIRALIVRQPHCLAVFLCCFVVGLAQGSTVEAGVKVSVERATIGVAADLLEGDDYYYRKDGTKVQYFRKKGLYLLPSSSPGASVQASWIANNKQLELVKQHQLTQRTMVRLREKTAAGVAAAMSDQTALALQQAVPVLANGKGQGDLEVLPFVTVRFFDNTDAIAAIDILQQQFNLLMLRKVNISGQVYSFKLNNAIYDVSQIFRLVRSVMTLDVVEWAEPQFNSRPVKHLMPSDALFTDQWNLHNTTQHGAQCDADVDATLAWDINTTTARGQGAVIAIIDDGVQTNHPDLAANIAAGGKDFVDDPGSCSGDPAYTGDGTVGPDNDPNPQAPSNCTFGGDDVVEDDHGTAVAGIAAAASNLIGIAGVAHKAQILPIRAISGYDSDIDHCTRLAEAMTYAGKNADVINASWEIFPTCTALEDAIDDVVAGTIMEMASNVSRRPNLGSPVIFSSGNSASGWYKVTVDNVPAGKHVFEWRFVRSATDFDFGNDDTVWVDDITWPDNSVETFESSTSLPAGFATACEINQCLGTACNAFSACATQWTINQDGVHTREGSSNSVMAGTDADKADACDYTYLTVERNTAAGSMSFWVWVSARGGGANNDKFEFLIDGVEQSSFGDVLVAISNDVAYPASYSNTIAVGASSDGIYDDNNDTAADLSKEERVHYSQYGSTLDLVAPSSNQHQGITTTDRMGADGYNSTTNSSSDDYTDTFGGTSAAAPVVSGVAAAMIAVDKLNNTLTAAQVRTYLRDGADKIGSYTYDMSGRNDEVGYGRVNMFQSIKLVEGSAMAAASESCLASNPFSSLSAYEALTKADPVLAMCPSQVPSSDTGICFPVPTNGKLVLVCL